MGQYYRIVLKNRRDGLVVNNRRFKDSGYILAKLTEHSYLGNYLTSCVAYAIEGNPTRVMWVGDYAKKHEIRRLTNRHLSFYRIWGDGVNVDHEFPFKGEFDYAGKFLVNHTKKLALSYDDYMKLSGGEAVFDYTIDPLPLLTAVGNGRGCGDYGGKNSDKVGTWAWDKLEITSEKPAGYRKFTVSFEEET